MATVTRSEGDISAGQNTIVEPLNADLNTLFNELNGGLDSDNLRAGAVTDEKMDVTVRQSTSRNETGVGNFVYTGILGSTSASLILSLTAGTAYVLGYRIAMSATDKTMTATKDNYVDLDQDGVFHVTPVAIAATAPSIYANSIRIGKATTNGTAITSYTDLATRSTAASPAKHRIVDCIVEYFSTTQVKVLPGLVEISGTNYINTTSSVVTVTGNTNWLTGSAAASTHVYVYALANSAGTFDVRLSSIAPNKTDTAGNANGVMRYLLNGGTYYRLLGHCRLDASVVAPFMTFVTECSVEVGFADSFRTGASAVAQTTWTALSLTGHVPNLSSLQVEMECYTITSGGAGQSFFFRPTGSAFTTGRVGGRCSGDAESNLLWIKPNASQSIDYRFGAANSHSLRIAGYRFAR